MRIKLEKSKEQEPKEQEPKKLKSEGTSATVGPVLEVRKTPLDGPSVFWSGHFYDYSGYAKANREVVSRVANTLNVSLMKIGIDHGFASVDRYTCARFTALTDTPIRDDAPLVRFLGPDYVPDFKGYKIVWTMMETYKTHYDFVNRINRDYSELWVPTEWNRKIMTESGVKIPSRIMPLGVNPLVYRPVEGAKLPACRLLTGRNAGDLAVPQGFIFISVGLPTFRKGFDFLTKAFDFAFRGRSDVHLVLGITHSPREWNQKVYEQFAGRDTCIWSLEGRYSEHGMARIYSACHAYVSASRGEGWNLPLCEAAACGLPVIAPENTSHPEVVGGNAWMFPIEGVAPHAEGASVSFWFKGMPMTVFGKKSLDGLVECLRTVEAGGEEVRTRAARLMDDMRTKWTWDNVSSAVVERLLEVQP